MSFLQIFGSSWLWQGSVVPYSKRYESSQYLTPQGQRSRSRIAPDTIKNAVPPFHSLPNCTKCTRMATVGVYLQEKIPENRGETLPPTPRTTNLGTAVGVTLSRLVQPRSTPRIRYLRHTHQFLDSLPRGTATAVPRFLALGVGGRGGSP
jgi:hypothetical protein